MKIKFDKRFVLEEAYQKYLYMLKYMPGDSRHSPSTNYRKPGIADVEGYPGTPGSDYPLYGYFASLVSATTILEIGTYQGGSAVMMSSNESNRIITYDVVDFIPGKVNRSNIEFRVGNFMRANYFMKKIDYDAIDLITIDVDPHNGIKEVKIVKYLEKHWKGGLILLDDIHNGKGMQKFWERIDREIHEVIDISDIGHTNQGSGLINFKRFFELEVIDYDREKLSVPTCPLVE